MNKNILFLLPFIFLFIACNEEEIEMPELSIPATYTFERDGVSSVVYQGQIDRIQMATELSEALKGFTHNEVQLLEMFRNRSENGSDVSPFENAKLNASTKSIKDKLATSNDYFAINRSESARIKLSFEEWISNQMAMVYPNVNQAANPGSAGQINDNGTARYVNEKGIELNQYFSKSLIGALMVDQIINNYLSETVLDNGDNITNNNAKIQSEGKPYTAMEHKWDEAYGYLFGNSSSPSDPLMDLGSADEFLNKYLFRVNNDPDFEGIAVDIYDAFRKGRAALLANDYKIRDEQAIIIKTAISEVIGIRAVYYLQQGKKEIEANRLERSFHDLSEGIGFVYSLRFTKDVKTGESYFSREEVDSLLAKMLTGNGLWDLDPRKLDEISETIASKFDFTIAQAAE